MSQKKPSSLFVNVQHKDDWMRHGPLWVVGDATRNRTTEHENLISIKRIKGGLQNEKQSHAGIV
jgi:hypothetical protein